MKVLFPLFILVFGLFFSCKKKVQPELLDVQDPCDCFEEANADFLMEEASTSVGSVAYFTDTDSILGSKNVRFKAIQDGDSYKWYIGSEVLTTKDVTRFFGPATLGSTVPITLVVNKTPNNKCFQNDDGYDSVVKYLTVTNYPMFDFVIKEAYYGSIEGTYRVKSAHLPDSFDITVNCVLNGINQQKLNIFNYDGNGSDCVLQCEMNKGSNYRELYALGGTGTLACDYLQGSIKNPKSGKAQMDFIFFYPSHPDYAERQYLGRKLN